jgi:hypothetical protein
LEGDGLYIHLLIKLVLRREAITEEAAAAHATWIQVAGRRGGRVSHHFEELVHLLDTILQ